MDRKRHKNSKQAGKDLTQSANTTLFLKLTLLNTYLRIFRAKEKLIFEVPAYALFNFFSLSGLKGLKIEEKKNTKSNQAEKNNKNIYKCVTTKQETVLKLKEVVVVVT